MSGDVRAQEDEMGRTVTAEADRQGVMVALVPAESASKALLEHSGGTEPLDEQHITLVYLGTLGDEIEDTELTRDQVINAVDNIALRYSPLNGEANGWGVFQNEGDVLVSLWNIPGINGLRQALVEDLRDVGIPVKQNYAFTPHQTMTYADAGQAQVPGRMDSQVESDFMHLVLSWGEQQYLMPLAGVRKESAGPARGGNPDNPGQFSSEDKGYRKKDKSKSDDSGDDSGDGAGGSKGDSGGGSEGGGKGRAPEGGQAAHESEGEAFEGEAEEPPEGYTAVPYDPEAASFTEEQRIAHGDMYGHYLPAGRYAEGDPRNEPEFERIMAEKTELSIKYASVKKEDIDAGETEGGQTEDLYDHVFDPETGKHNAYVPERQAIHQQVLSDLSELYANYPRNGKAVVMAGPPGAGKSTYLNAHGYENFGIEVKGDDDPKDDPPAKNFVTINPDDFKELLPVDMSRYPGLEDNEVAFMVHEESSYLAKIATEHFMSQGYDVIIDVTLGNSASAIRKYVTPFEDKGYDYQVALVDGTMNNSLNNAGLRYKSPDRETGVRSYGGRFLPMGVVESNNPTEGSGYRSKNAEQFVEFIQQEGVSKAIVYDPETKAVAVAKEGTEISDWRSDGGEGEGENEGGEVVNLSDRRRSDEDGDGVEDKAAVRLRNRVMSSILRGTERDDMSKTARSLPHGHTEITTKIVEYSDGQIDLSTLTDWLVNHTYSPAETNPHEVGTAEWYNWIEDQPLQSGTYDEVAQAAAAGLLDWNDYAEINKAVVNSANPAAQ